MKATRTKHEPGCKAKWRRRTAQRGRVIDVVRSAGDQALAMKQVLQQVMEAAGGRAFPLDAASSKVLRFMLSDAGGCDAIVKDSSFEIRYGGHPARHRYFPELAPRIVTALRSWSGMSTMATSCQATLGPAVIEPVESFPSWSFGRRIVWIAAAPESFTISIRDGESEPERRGPAPLPQPIDFARVVLELPGTQPCPHCARSATSYRKLSDGALVCAACGRSFRPDFAND